MTTAGDQTTEQILARLEELERVHRRPLPFWHNTAAVGILAGVIAVIPASLTAVHEYYQTEREVRLNVARYQHERTVSYLDRALNPETTEAKQLQVLRFLSQLPDDKDASLRQWAEGELARVQQAVEQLKEVSRDAEKTLETLQTKRVALEAEAEQILVAAESEGVKDVEPLLQVKQDELEHTRREIQQVEQKGMAAAIRSGEVFEPAPAPAAALSSPTSSRSGRPWRIQIAAKQDEAEIERLAAIVSGQGVSPQIYAKPPMHYLFVGSYGSREEAYEHVAEAKRYLGQGAWPRNLDTMCKDPKRKGAITVCAKD